jgi:hypothetical protein
MTLQPPQPPTPASGPHRTVSRGLTGTIRGFLYAAAATSLAGVLATYNELGKFNDFKDGTGRSAAARLSDAEEVSGGVLGLFALTGVVLAVLVVIWWYQSYQAIERTGAAGRSWSSGWAIGGWFIPVGNFVIPKLVLNEIDRVSGAAEAGLVTEWRSRPLLANANLWWGFFVAGGILLGIGANITTAQIESLSFDADMYRIGLWLTLLGLAADVPAALFGAASVRVFGERLNR